MKLTDAELAAMIEDLCLGLYPATIDALATEVLESRAEIAKLRKALSVWEDAFATGRLGLAAARAAIGRDDT
jgi:hypothetical protein